MKIVTRLVLAAAAIALGAWLWGVFFPGPEKIIRARLQEIAERASFPANQAPFNNLADVQRLCALTGPDVVIQVDAPGVGRRSLQGRDELRQAALTYRSMAGGAKVEFPDVHVTLAPDKQNAVASVTLKARAGIQSDTIFQEMKLTFQKLDGHWLVTRAETVKTLR